ncbi:glycoside hydrolase family protein [Streptomyces justiciae]|uniref:Glycogen debranching protein n=1 Tax=Streptomyces justiciae TaxID=2780140 RepID=A0ABU3LM83_9ACTN|nr:hypothetical protein [Streptomyces justiciae]MDT7840253.1 hypothetical protein [Streptomyces justiciae]
MRPVDSLAFGGGHAVVDPGTGAPVQFVDEADPARRFLLDADVTPWHSVEHQWGSGHLITDRGAARWHAPARLRCEDGRIEAVHEPLPGVRVEIRRTAHGSLLRECYTLVNDTPDPLTVSGLGIQVPFADLYTTAEESLDQAVNAHLFTGGTWAWALARPMSGTGRSLGLIVREGAVRAYSVESRNVKSNSHVRGHLVLLVTDRARNPEAFGGQPELRLAPGESTTLAWELGWYTSDEDFTRATRPPAELSAHAAELGDSITVQADSVTAPDPDVKVEQTVEGRFRVQASRHGSYPLDIGEGARTEVLFHLPLEEMVRRRVAYITRHQRARDRAGLLAHAFVPVDTRTGLTQSTNGWSDWTDGSERIAMPLLLQAAATRGWADPAETDPLLDGWSAFACRYLLDDTDAPRRGSQDHDSGPRLYDMPWLARFFHDRYQAHGRADDLDRAARILERSYAMGGALHLSIGLSPAVLDVCDRLEAAGQADRAQALRGQLIDSAREFVRLGRKLPAHEVNYEQSIVAPLLDLLSDAHALTGDPVLLDAVAERLPWLLAFGGPQPHARLHGIAIRHWDGFWFGADRLWGDVFPHYWSTLTATTLRRLPAALRTPGTERLAEAILRANMANYREDGSATCAFVMPSTVDGRAAHRADPLANDQDWHLYLWLASGQVTVSPSRD